MLLAKKHGKIKRRRAGRTLELFLLVKIREFSPFTNYHDLEINIMSR
jgi:hypothetical protein